MFNFKDFATVNEDINWLQLIKCIDVLRGVNDIDLAQFAQAKVQLVDGTTLAAICTLTNTAGNGSRWTTSICLRAMSHERSGTGAFRGGRGDCVVEVSWVGAAPLKNWGREKEALGAPFSFKNGALGEV